MNWGFIVLCCVYALGLGVDIAKHGEPKTGERNALMSAIAVVVSLVLVLWAMRWKV